MQLTSQTLVITLFSVGQRPSMASLLAVNIELMQFQVLQRTQLRQLLQLPEQALVVDLLLPHSMNIHLVITPR